MDKELSVRQAQPSDYTVIQDMLIETAKWLNKKGSTQWKGLLNGNDTHDTPKAIERGEVYIAEKKGQPAGMFVLWDKQTEWDKGLWGEENTEKYYYLHRITVEKNHHGQGIGKKLIEAAVNVAKEDKKEQVRLDCIAANEYLNQFYPSCGFKFVKTVYDHEGAEEAKDFNLYKRMLN